MATNSALTIVRDIDRYMEKIRQYPVLTQDEEIELARRWRDEGDVQAAHLLVTSNLRFVVKIAHEYKGYGARLMDLIQEGSIGLMQAVKRFDPDKGYRLISYSVFWIRSFIHNYLMGTTRMIRIGTSRAHRRLFFKLRNFKAKFASQGGESRDDIIDAATVEFGVSREDVIEMDSHLGGYDASLDAPSIRTGATLAEVLPSGQKNQEDTIAELEMEADRGARLHEALDKLDAREKEIITLRYLRETPMQLKEIGEQMGVSKQRIAQIEKRAFGKLKETLGDLAA